MSSRGRAPGTAGPPLPSLDELTRASRGRQGRRAAALCCCDPGRAGALAKEGLAQLACVHGTGRRAGRLEGVHDEAQVLDAADKARDGKEEVDSGQSDVDYHREELVFRSMVSTSMQHRPEQHVTCEREVQSRAISGLSCKPSPFIISGSDR